MSTTPSASEIIKAVTENACSRYVIADPIDQRYCRLDLRYCKKETITECKRNAARFLNSLRLPPDVTEKTFVLTSAAERQKLQLKVTLNKTGTLSFWIQQPITELHIRAALLDLMSKDITHANLCEVGEKYKKLLFSAKAQLKNMFINCRNIDPTFLQAIVNSLFLRGYTPVTV